VSYLQPIIICSSDVPRFFAKKTTNLKKLQEQTTTHCRISHNVVFSSHPCGASAWYVSSSYTIIGSALSPRPFARLITPPGRPIKGLPETITVDSDAPASEIFRKIATVSKFSIHRLRVTKGSDGSAIPNAAGVSVHQTGLRNKSAVDVKDLGMMQAILGGIGCC
jgi:hypothetical protein